MRDAPPALRDEVLCGGAPTGLIVDIDVARLERDARPPAENHWYPSRLEARGQRLGLVQREEQHRVDVTPGQVLLETLDVGRRLGCEQHHLQPVRRQLLTDRAEQP